MDPFDWEQQRDWARCVWIGQGLWILHSFVSFEYFADMALQYAERGERLILTARREKLLQELAAQCRELGAPEVVISATDVSDSAQLVGSFPEDARIST